MDIGREETLRKKAYEKWDAEGRPEGQHEKHWRDAESEFSTAEDADLLESDRGVVKNEEPDSSTDASHDEGEVPERPLAPELMPIGDPAGAA